MERIHPNLSLAAACAMTALSFGISGCRSSSSGIAGSPFMSPDRVPPPSTRALQPGQAAPYYQGDPLPAMQSAASPAPPAIAASPTEVDARTPSGRTLTWTQPGSQTQPAMPAPPQAAPMQAQPMLAANSAQPPQAQLQPQPQAQPQPQPQQIAMPGEGAVSVPTDADPLRFPLPAPQPAETAAPIAFAPLPARQQPAQPVAAPQLQQPSNVQLASYTAPIPSAPPLTTNIAAASQPAQANSPWRSPQIAQATAASPGAPQPIALQQYGAPPTPLPAPPTIPQNTVAATLRAVDSPPQPGDPIPRVRMPGYVASTVSADGFRPRTSMQ